MVESQIPFSSLKCNSIILICRHPPMQSYTTPCHPDPTVTQKPSRSSSQCAWSLLTTVFHSVSETWLISCLSVSSLFLLIQTLVSQMSQMTGFIPVMTTSITSIPLHIYATFSLFTYKFLKFCFYFVAIVLQRSFATYWFCFFQVYAQ